MQTARTRTALRTITPEHAIFPGSAFRVRRKSCFVASEGEVLPANGLHCIGHLGGLDVTAFVGDLSARCSLAATDWQKGMPAS